MARSRVVRKLDQKRATSLTESGTMLSFGTFTRSRLRATRGRTKAHRPTPQESLLETTSDLTGTLRELVAEGAIGNGDAVIDGASGRPRLLAGLEAHGIQKGRLGKVCFGEVAGVMNALPPADEVQQVVSVDA